eukprot:4927516-Amphidinium_carterae.1
MTYPLFRHPSSRWVKTYFGSISEPTSEHKPQQTSFATLLSPFLEFEHYWQVRAGRSACFISAKMALEH